MDSGDHAAKAWAALLAAALPADKIPPALTAMAEFFGSHEFGQVLADPAAVRDQAPAISEAFERMCSGRDLSVCVITGFLAAGCDQQLIPQGHMANEVQADDGRRLVVDWTARQFDPKAPVPLIVTLAAWQAFWRPLLGQELDNVAYRLPRE